MGTRELGQRNSGTKLISSNIYNSYHQVVTNFDALTQRNYFTYDRLLHGKIKTLIGARLESGGKTLGRLWTSEEMSQVANVTQSSNCHAPTCPTLELSTRIKILGWG